MLLKTSSIYLTSNIISATLSFFMIPIYTEYLSTDEYGLYGFLMVFYTVFSIIIHGNIFNLISREYYNKNDILYNKIFIGNAIIYYFIISFFLIFILFFIGKYLLMFFNLSIELYWLIIIAIIALFKGLVELFFNILKLEFLALNVLFITVFISILNIGLSYIFIVYLMMKWQGIIISMLISNIIGFLILFLVCYNKQFFILKINIDYIYKIFIFILKYLPTTLNWRIITLSDRFFITKMLNLEIMGLYTLGQQLSNIFGMLTTAVNQAWLPIFMKKINEKKFDYINKFIFLYIVLLSFILIILYFIIPTIIPIFFSEDYFDSIKYFHVFLIILFFSTLHSIVSKFLIFYKDESLISLFTSIGAILNLILNYFFIKIFGGIGAIISTTIVYSIIVSLEVFYIKKRKYYVSDTY